MTTKRFINTSNMQQEVLDLLQKEFLTKQFYGDKIEVKVDLKDVIEKKMAEQHVIEPNIYITVAAYQKILTLVKEFNTEVAWHCLVEHPAGTNSYLIYDVLVFPQYVTGATANGIDGEYEMWLATLPDAQFDHCRCHMHSHVNMNTTPSTVDENYYSNLMTQVQDYYITMILNKRDEYHLRFYDVVNNILYSDKELIVCLEDGTLMSTWFNSVKGVVKEPVRAAVPSTHGALSDWDKRCSKQDDISYGSYEEYLKKKEKDTTTPTTKGRGRPKKNEEKKDNSVLITGPDNITHKFITIDYAINYIYNQYPRSNHKFSKNDMRKHLARDGSIAYDYSKGNFDYGFLDRDGGLEYAILKCDLWEVTAREFE